MSLSIDESSPVEDVASTLSPSIFPFLTLPAELRLMIYEALLPDEVYLSGSVGSRGLPPAIQALMTIPIIRGEILKHLFTTYQFNWVDVKEPFKPSFGWDRFKQHALPYITSLRINLKEPFSKYTYDRRRPRPFFALLRWMRWRSLRSHLYPWHLKNLQLVETPIQPPWQSGFSGYLLFPYYSNVSFEPPEALDFPRQSAVVPGLESLTVILNDRPSDETVKTFLERCARNGTEGKIGYWQCVKGKLIGWLSLQGNQIVRTTG